MLLVLCTVKTADHVSATPGVPYLLYPDAAAICALAIDSRESRPNFSAGLCHQASELHRYGRAYSTGLRPSTDDKEIQVRDLIHSICSAKLAGSARTLCLCLVCSTE